MKGGALKGSARKKTTSLDGVLSNMRRHKIIEDNMEEPEKKEASWDAFIDIFSLPSTWLSKNHHLFDNAIKCYSFTIPESALIL